MKAFALALVALAISIGTAEAAVPMTVPFAARLVDDTTGDPMTGTQHLTFAMFDAAAAGNMMWTEARDVDAGDEGVTELELGGTTAFPAALFDGTKHLFLEVKVGDTTLSPRIAIASVPYAIKAGSADDSATIGGLTPAQLQKRVSGVCGAASFVTAVNPDGTVVCTLGATGTGDITGVTAGNGLSGGAASGEATLSIINCGVGQVLKSDGTTWGCGADANSGGDITSVTTGLGTGLQGGGTSGDVGISLVTSCGTNQVLKWSGAGWACADDATNSGTITGVTTAATSGLVGGGTTGTLALSLTQTCAVGQVLKWNGAASGWGCANDIDTDTDTTNVVAGNGLTGGGAGTSVTVNVGAGTGITVGVDTVALDTAFTDGRYRGKSCAAGYALIGIAHCAQISDVGTGAVGLTFGGCALHCSGIGAHMCDSVETRAYISAGSTNSPTGDWINSQDTATTALYVISGGTSDNPALSASQTAVSVGTPATATYCRCCTSLE